MPERKPTVDKNHLIPPRGDNKRPYVLYAGLLDAAHTMGLRGITTTLTQIPNDLNGQTAIVWATVEMAYADGAAGTFTGLGDANPGNVNRMMATALIRMAETRAKARALRDAINASEYELEGESDPDADAPATPKAPTLPAPTPSTRGSSAPGPRPSPPPATPEPTGGPSLADDDGSAATGASRPVSSAELAVAHKAWLALKNDCEAAGVDAPDLTDAQWANPLAIIAAGKKLRAELHRIKAEREGTPV